MAILGVGICLAVGERLSADDNDDDLEGNKRTGLKITLYVNSNHPFYPQVARTTQTV